jgi:hypothetical protein
MMISWQTRLLGLFPRPTLEVTEVRIQRLQEIACADAFVGGIAPETDENYLAAELDRLGGCGIPGEPPEVFAYVALWASVHGTGSWTANPEILASASNVYLGIFTTLSTLGGFHEHCRALGECWRSCRRRTR